MALDASELLDSIAANVAVLSPDGSILRVNQAWCRFFAEHGGDPRRLGGESWVGLNYLQVCAASWEGQEALQGITSVLRGASDEFRLEYLCGRRYLMLATPLGSRRGAVVAHFDLSSREPAPEPPGSPLSGTNALGLWTFQVSENRVTWTAEVEQMLGIRSTGMTLAEWLEHLPSQDRAAKAHELQQAITFGRSFSTELRVTRPDGTLCWLSQTSQIHFDAQGQPASLVAILRDVSEHQSVSRRPKSYDAILEMIAAGSELAPTLNAVCGMVESRMPGSYCSILLLEPKTDCLRVMGAPTLPDSYNRAVDGLSIGPKVGCCGTAAYSKQAVLSPDIATDPLWENFRDLAVAHELRSCVSFPIFASGNLPGLPRGTVLGTFAIYNAGADAPNQPLCAKTLGDIGDSPSVIEATHLSQVAIERQRAHEALREGEMRFRQILDSINSVVLLRDQEGRFIFANQKAHDILHIPTQDWLGHQAEELSVLPDTVRELLSLPPEEPASRKPVRWLRADGRQATAVTASFELRSADGEPFARCDTLTKIAELVELQEELYRLWSHALDPLCVIDFSGRLQRFNPAWTRLLGWSEEQLLILDWIDLIHPEDSEEASSAFRRLTSGTSEVRFEVRCRKSDGDYLWFSCAAISRPQERSIYGFLRNVTEEKHLADQVRHSQKMEAVGKLASGIAHDFNNLLTVISSYVDLLVRAHGRDADLDLQMLNEIQTAARRAAELTSQLLAFSRRAPVRPQVVHPNTMVQSCLRLLTRVIGEDILLETNLKEVSAIHVDPGQFEQVLMNLAVNSRDAMPEGGRLTISTEMIHLDEPISTVSGNIGPGSFVRVSVADTGGGIAPEVRARIFEPFFTTKGVGQGTGLGLSTIYGIAQQAGGAVELESELNRGTVLRVLFPVAEVEARAPLEETVPTGGGNETILLVEDEPRVRDVIRRILETLGYKIILAANGREALEIERVQQLPIHLLISDVVMPEMGGMALVDEMRRRRPGIKILMMSGYTEDERLRGDTGLSFVQKPFSVAAIADEIRAVLAAPVAAEHG